MYTKCRFVVSNVHVPYNGIETFENTLNYLEMFKFTLTRYTGTTQACSLQMLKLYFYVMYFYRVPDFPKS